MKHTIENCELFLLRDSVNICMFADGAGISLSLHVPASSEGER
jgi:hypothetical protein